MRRLRFALMGLVAATLASAAGPQPAATAEAGHPPFSDVQHWVKVFEDESRREWQKPREVLDSLGIFEGDTVADLGAGTGYFTGMLTSYVGATGKVYAVDLEQALLDYIKTRGDGRQEVITPVLAAPDDPKLPAGGVDLILVVNTWHHIENRSKYLRKLAAALSPEGRVALIDYRAGELPVGPPPEEKLSRETVIAEFEKAKWSFVADSVMLPHQYFLIFHPPRKR